MAEFFNSIEIQNRSILELNVSNKVSKRQYTSEYMYIFRGVYDLSEWLVSPVFENRIFQLFIDRGLSHARP